jgi:putative oxidoreductase
MNVLRLIDKLVQRIATAMRWFPPLLARVTLAAVFVPTGWGKLHNLEKVTAFFTELGIPAPHLNAVFVGATELVCGALLLVGLVTRFASAPIIGSMVVAILTAKRESLEGALDVFGLEEFLFIPLCVWLMVAGPGKASLDWLLAKRLGLGSPTS